MKALICGAGIAGLSLAGRLGHHGWDVVLVEQAPGPRHHGYMIDFSGPGFEALAAMGLLPQLRAAASPVDTFRYIDHEGRTTVSLDYGLFTKALDGQIVSVMRPALEQMLRESLGPRTRVRYGTTIEQITPESAVLSDGDVVDADVIVGADGIHSRIRSLTFGDEARFLHDLGMHTGAFIFDDHDVLDEVAGQFVLTETIDRQLGLYGLGNGRVAAFTVHRTGSADYDDARDELRAEFSGMGPLVDAALERCPPAEEIYFDRVAQVLMPQWTHGRVGLIGDAACAVSLVAGQGASLGVAGAFVLAELLSTAGSIPEILTEYERRWRPIADSIQKSARERVVEVFLPRRRNTLLLRRWGFRAMHVPGLRRLLTGSLFPKGSHSVTELVSAAAEH